ncbi:BadF/BadG/BcrA/BcrD ATPase family protein [Pseudoduganella umbonata]|uniref:ATPase n=1 Tax=Pseudoduganella umbonata TaxID=864828 RepID=A0A4P8HWH3_9BURK|nr:BadF/BadG/BcrA/BcrD ATPase family protein [Pseudoduganella umbonata]MBB3223347.1 glucosamine kinase [Pseudoduganella umbonata]QCP13746.1 ATPase [Pseudoduganella umbonata]
MIEYLIGVDGGGTGTRVRLALPDGTLLGEGSSGPSALLHGIPNAWNAVEQAAAAAFAAAGIGIPERERIAIGLGLAGVHNRQWAADFIGANPGYAAVALESDAYTTVLGAHDGRPGAIIALGTGSVGEVLCEDGSRREVGGWGFPSGDEAGGAWIGMRAVNHIQQVIDGRAAGSRFADAVMAACGDGRDPVQAWLASATQTRYAQLARIVLEHAADNDTAREILIEAGRQVGLMAGALDTGGKLPIALCGGLAEAMRGFLPGDLLARIVPANGDSAAGALQLIRRQLAVSTAKE